MFLCFAHWRKSPWKASQAPPHHSCQFPDLIYLGHPGCDVDDIWTHIGVEDRVVKECLWRELLVLDELQFFLLSVPSSSPQAVRYQKFELILSCHRDN